MTGKRINLDDYYTTPEAVERLSKNSKREVDANYPRTLARYGKIRFVKVGRGSLYLKQDVDSYVVSEKRGPRKRKDSQDSRVA